MDIQNNNCFHREPPDDGLEGYTEAVTSDPKIPQKLPPSKPPNSFQQNSVPSQIPRITHSTTPPKSEKISVPIQTRSGRISRNPKYLL